MVVLPPDEVADLLGERKRALAEQAVQQREFLRAAADVDRLPAR
ncbi:MULTISPECIES: hypothetical protein [Nocardia]|nr:MULTISPECIES: hypothetical protein [Nocardia]